MRGVFPNTNDTSPHEPLFQASPSPMPRIRILPIVPQVEKIVQQNLKNNYDIMMNNSSEVDCIRYTSIFANAAIY